MKLRCMMSDIPVDAYASPDDVILVIQKGKPIGVIHKQALENVKTVRMTFTRDTPDGVFKPLQGQGIEVFRDTHESER